MIALIVAVGAFCVLLCVAAWTYVSSERNRREMAELQDTIDRMESVIENRYQRMRELQAQIDRQAQRSGTDPSERVEQSDEQQSQEDTP